MLIFFCQAKPPRFRDCLPSADGSLPCLSKFLNGRSFTLFDLLGYTFDELQFFNLDVSEWKNNAVYQNLHQFVTQLTIVNDPAERFIKTLKDWLGTVKSEKRLMSTLLSVEELRRLDEQFKRCTITKADLKRVLDKIVRR